MRNDSGPSDSAFQQQSVPALPARTPSPARTPTHAAPQQPVPDPLHLERKRGDPDLSAASPSWGDTTAAPTEDLHLEGLGAPSPVPAATRVYEDWQMPALVEGSAYDGGVFEGPVFEGPLYAGPGSEGPLYAGPGSEGPLYAGPGSEGPLYAGPGYSGPAYEGPLREDPAREGPVREGSVFEGYVPARVPLDRLETRRKSVAAKQGWRGLVHGVTGINLPPGKDEIHEMALKERVQRMVRRTFPIAILGVKGGVGKTVVTEALGSTFSAVRGDRVIAVDLDPDAGNLISRHGRESDLSITDLVADNALTRYLDVRAHTSQNKTTRLEVLTGPDFARTSMPLMNSQVDAVMPVLTEHYSLVLMDTGTGLKTNLMSAVLAQTRALVMVSSASIDALEESQVGLEWLRNNGYQNLLDTMVLVINNVQRGKPNVDLQRAVKLFSRQIGRERIFVLPFDSHIFEGGQITLELLSVASRRRYLELAAAISELFPRVAN